MTLPLLTPSSYIDALALERDRLRALLRGGERRVTWAAGMRWSYSTPAWCGFFASLRDGRVLLRHELTWLGAAPEDAALDIIAASVAWKARLLYTVAQPEIFPTDKKPSGETVSETFQRAGVVIRRGSDDRVNGWSRLRSWMQPRRQESGLIEPSFLVHPDCAHFLRTLPTLVKATDNPDDVAKTHEGEDNPAHGARFYFMSRPMPWTETAATPNADPLSAAAMWRDLRGSGTRPRKRVGESSRRRVLY